MAEEGKRRPLLPHPAGSPSPLPPSAYTPYEVCSVPFSHPHHRAPRIPSFDPPLSPSPPPLPPLPPLPSSLLIDPPSPHLPRVGGAGGHRAHGGRHPRDAGHPSATPSATPSSASSYSPSSSLPSPSSSSSSPCPTSFPTFTPCLLIYRPDDTPLGSLYPTPLPSPSSPSPHPPPRLSLHHLTDIFLGRQSLAYLSSPSTLPPPPPSHCFSASTRIGLSLHVQCGSREVTSAWVLGINAIMMGQGGRRIRTKGGGGGGGGGTGVGGVGVGGEAEQVGGGGEGGRGGGGGMRVSVPVSPSSSLLSLSSSSSPHIHPPPSPPPPPPPPPKSDPSLEAWLSSLGSAFLPYYPTFLDNGVDLPFLATLSPFDLDELGVTRLHAKRMLQAVAIRGGEDTERGGMSATSTPPYMAASAPSSLAGSAVSTLRGPAGGRRQVRGRCWRRWLGRTRGVGCRTSRRRRSCRLRQGGRAWEEEGR